MAEPPEPRTKLERLTPKQRSRLKQEIRFAHSQLTDPTFGDKQKFLDGLKEHPDLQIFLDAYEAKFHETPQKTYQRFRADRPPARPVADSPDPSLNASAIHLAGATGPQRNPKIWFANGLVQGEVARAIPTVNHLTDSTFRKLTPDLQEEVIAQVALLMESDAERASWLKWLRDRKAIRNVFYAIHPPVPIAHEVTLSFRDRDDEIVMDEFHRMVPTVRKNYMHQILEALHGKDKGRAAECRSWLLKHPELKATCEAKFGAGIKKLTGLDNVPPLITSAVDELNRTHKGNRHDYSIEDFEDTKILIGPQIALVDILSRRYREHVNERAIIVGFLEKRRRYTQLKTAFYTRLGRHLSS